MYQNKLHELYGTRVRELEAEGLCTSDAQGVADAEFMRQHGTGWEFM
jgi:hypothetical protein